MEENKHCNNCGGTPSTGDDSQLRACSTCRSFLCSICWSQHRKWASELKTTDRMTRREERINGYITGAMNLMFSSLSSPPVTTPDLIPSTRINKSPASKSPEINKGKKQQQMNLDDLFW